MLVEVHPSGADCPLFMVKKFKIGSESLPRPLKHTRLRFLLRSKSGICPCPVRNRLSTYELVNGVICVLDRKVKITTLYFKRAVI
jgi:hypothetical protein